MKWPSLLLLLLFAQLAGVVGGVDVVGVGVFVGLYPLQVDVVGDCDVVALPLEGLQLLPLRLRVQAVRALLLALPLVLPVLLQQRLLHARPDRCLRDQRDVFGWRQALPLAHRSGSAQIVLETSRVAATLPARLPFPLLAGLLALPAALFARGPAGIRPFFVGLAGSGVVVGGSAVGSPGGSVGVPAGLGGAGLQEG